VPEGGPLDGVERRLPPLLERRVGGVAPGDEGVEVPGQVAEPARLGPGGVVGEGVEDLADLGGELRGPGRLGELVGVLEADDDVGHLDAGVVEVVLDLDPLPEAAEEVDEDVAEDGVPEVPDVGGLVRVDVRVLDDDLARDRLGLGRGRLSIAARAFGRSRKRFT
jgi:hypothetical protein